MRFKESVISSVRDSTMAESLSPKPIPLYGIAFSPRWWGKAAMQVALDPAVSDKAYRVFTVIAAYGKGNIANVGQRRVAKLMGKTQSYISKRVQELRKSGWLGTKNVGERQENRLCAFVCRLRGRAAGGRGCRATFRPADRRAVRALPPYAESASHLGHLPEVHSGDE